MSEADHRYTKHDNPCIQKAADDEPLFVLRAQDLSAPSLVREWALGNELNAPNKAKNARLIADQMEAWGSRKLADDDAPANKAPVESGSITKGRLPRLNDEMEFILGRPCFAIVGIARRLEALGLYKIQRRAESEQAAVIHWMLSLYLEHGESWRKEAEKILLIRTYTGPLRAYRVTDCDYYAATSFERAVQLAAEAMNVPESEAVDMGVATGEPLSMNTVLRTEANGVPITVGASLAEMDGEGWFAGTDG